jgi:hypothetical protein
MSAARAVVDRLTAVKYCPMQCVCTCVCCVRAGVREIGGGDGMRSFEKEVNT